MSVAKKTRKGEEPTKIEQRKGGRWEREPPGKTNSLHARPIYTGQTQGEGKKNI